ncbi:MAG: glycosyltransferase family 39 protein [Phycisphaerae bacterium]|nr:glycosyltransferase family 39 protein [Phycisphaerae bacterium]
MSHPRRNPWRDAAILTLLCAVAYTAGLTTHGLTNWQEARRAVVGREMFRNNEWIVPTYFDEPYIAKPPMIYWAQILIGHTRAALGATPFHDETELRLTVALAGILGVLATYFAARSILLHRTDPALSDDAAWLGALGLAAGVLYFRSSRIGELDVLTVPFVVTAVAALAHAHRQSRHLRRTPWTAVALAAVAATLAALTKGPPALLVIALAGYLPMLLSDPSGTIDEPRWKRAASIAAALGFCLATFAAWLIAPRVHFPMDWLGLIFFGAVGAVIAVAIVRLSDPPRAWESFLTLAHTHPLLVLGLPMLAVWAWGRMVSSRIGAETVTTLAAAELDDNLRLLVLDSPAKNIGFMLYGLAPISLAMIAGLAWIARTRPPLTAGQRVPIVWCAAGLAAFSVAGKGVARYLTPVWPGVAMLGGFWLAHIIRDSERKLGHRRLRFAAAAVAILSMLVQTWWYGLGREIYFGDRSPRKFMQELLPKAPATALATWKMDEPAIDFYAEHRLPILETDARLIDLATEHGTLVLIGRTAQANEWVSQALHAGLTVNGIELRARYRWRADGERIGAWRIAR